MALVLLKSDSVYLGGTPPTFDTTAYEWDTLARAVVSGTSVTPYSAIYDKPVDEIVDSYCLNPGVSPFERQEVYHDGAGGVTLPTPISGSGLCAPIPTSGLAITAVVVTPEGVESFGSATVSVTDAVGAVEYSLDGFRRSKQSSSIFNSLIAGNYTVSARDTTGATATAPVTVTAPRGLRYRLPFLDAAGNSCRADLFVRGYAGAEEYLTPSGSSPVIIRWPGGATDHVFTQLLRGSECEISVLVETLGQLTDLYASDERRTIVKVFRSNSLIWTGYLLPEQWEAPHLSPPFESVLRATDAVGALTLPFADPLGNVLTTPLLSHIDTLRHCIMLAGLGDTLPFSVALQMWSDRMLPAPGVDPLALVGTRTAGWEDEDGVPLDAVDVLKAILGYYQTRFYQWAGRWYVERLTDFGPVTGGRLTRYTALGVPGETTYSYRPETVILPFDTDDRWAPHWVNASQIRSLRPAVREVEIANEIRPTLNLLPEGDAWPESWQLPSGDLWQWEGNAAYSIVEDPDDAEKRALQMPFAGFVAASQAQMLALASAAPGDKCFRTDLGNTYELTGTPYSSLASWTDRGATVYDYIERRIRVQTAGTEATYGVVIDIERLTGTDGGADSRFVLAVAINGWTLVANGLPQGSTNSVSTYFQLDTVRKKPEAQGPGSPFGSPDAPFDILIRLYPHHIQGDVLIRSVKLVLGEQENNQGAGVFDFKDPQPVVKTTAATGALRATRRDDGGVMALVEDADPYARHPSMNRPTGWQNSVIHADGRPLVRWFEDPDTIAQPSFPAYAEGFAAADFVARDRAVWQARPAQALSGQIDGWLSYGPGTLISDPEAGDRLFAQTSTELDLALMRWSVTAVELTNAPAAAIPDTHDHLLLETGGLFLTEDGAHITLESD